MAQIRINNASLIFKVRRNKRLSIKEWVVRWMFRRSVNPIIEVRALEGISFRAGEGEKVGVIGANGAGKSTLLRMIAGIYKPTSGQCLVNGKVSSLFDLALGFELDASGWENMNFRGYLQGETPRTIEEKKQ